jgi:hypothetical protein
MFVSLAMLGGSVLRSQALSGPLFADDWDHYAMEVGIYPVARGPLARYDFVSGDRAEREAMMRRGRLPWWTDPNIHLAVWRPLSSLLSHVDFAWLGAAHYPAASHWHSLFWWLILLAGVAALLGDVLPLPAAGVGVLMYAVDDCHVLPFAWSANRSELVAIGLIVWALWAHLRWRLARQPGMRALSLLLVGLGLLAGEHALAPLGYVVAFELVAPSRLRTRVRALLPIAALTVTYMAFRQVLGHGLAGSSFYIDPITEPLRYVSLAAQRLPLLLGDLTFGWPAEAWHWPPDWRGVVLAMPSPPSAWLSVQHFRALQLSLGLAALLGVAGWSVTLVRRSPPQPWEALRWLVPGAALATLPVTGTMPMSRLTAAAAIGFSAALGCALVWAGRQFVRARPWSLRLCAVLIAALILELHVVRAAFRSQREVAYYVERARSELAWVQHAELDRDLNGKHVMIVTARDWTSQWVLPATRHFFGLGMPESCQLLSPVASSPYRLTRHGVRELDLRIIAQPPDPTFTASVYRRETPPLRVGEVVDATDFQVRVLALQGSEPNLLRFEFPFSLDDPRYVFLYPFEHGLSRVHLPPPGESITLPPAAWPTPVPPPRL